MKKIFGLFILMLSVFLLVACGNSSANKPADGEYYRANKNTKTIDSLSSYGVDGMTLRYYNSSPKKIYTIDDKNLQVRYNDEVKDYSYEDGMLTIGGYRFVLKGSKKYKELINEGYRQE